MTGTTLTHITANDVTIGDDRLRQRCAWCGAVLLDYDLTRVAVQVERGEEPRPPGAWPVGRLVRVAGDNPRSFELLDDTEKLPPDACAHIDHEFTRQ